MSQIIDVPKASRHWDTSSLGDFITLKRGYDLPKQDRVHGPVPVVSSSGISDYSSAAKAKGPGVVTGRYGTLGKVFYIEGEYWPLNTTLYVSDFKGNDPRFVSYLLRTINFLAYSDKAAVPGINRNHLHEALVTYPSDISEQRNIASTLGAFDDKIVINEKLSATLEAMAGALFKSWFVDFDPVRKKAAGRGTGLGPRPTSLFPRTFELSELGEIPRTWTVGCIGDIASVSRTAINPQDFPDEVFEHYSIPAFDADRSANIETGESIKSNKFVVPPGCVLLSRLNPRIPRVWMPEVIGSRRAICSTEFAVMLPKAPPKEWLYCLFSSELFCRRFATMVTGTSGSHQRVRSESLLGIETIIPTQSAVEIFTEIVSPLLSRNALIRRESLTLKSLRDALLPKLLSGRLRLGETELILESSH